MQLPRPVAIARAYLLSFAFWCGISLLMGLQYQPLDYQNFWRSFAGFLVQVVTRAFAMATWTPPIFYLVERYLPLAKRRFRYLLLWALGAPIFVLLYTSFVWLLSPPYDDTLHRYAPRSFRSLQGMISTSFADEIFTYIAIVVAAHGYAYLKRARKQEAEKHEYQQALAASELQALKMQLHPHFLFNTLHGIATLIDEDAGKARNMIVKLSELLRTSLDRDSADLIPFESELRFVRQYLDLGKMRFGDRLKIEWLIDRETYGLLVPQMILQPLVENAIQHGIAPSRESGWIEVAASASDGMLKIIVRNSNNIIRQTSKGTGLGLRSVEVRLRYLYGDDANMHLMFNANRTVTVSLRLPALDSEPAGVHPHPVKVVL